MWHRLPHRGALAVLAVVLLAAPLRGAALGCGFPAGQLPPGSYQASCTNCSVQGAILACDCLTIGQALNHTTIDITNCQTDPANTNGVLVCTSCTTKGACCLDDGSCAVKTTEGCALVGTYQGDFKACSQVSCGEDIFWINPAGGDFGTKENWDPVEVPSGSDRLHFELASTFAVQLGGARTLDNARVRASLISLSGGTLTLPGGGSTGLTIGDGARLTLAGATVKPAGVLIGDVALGAPSSLVVPANGVLTATGTARIGDAATGVLDVTGGDATLGTTSVGGPAESGGPALTVPRSALPGGPAADTAPAQAGGKIRVNGGGGLTLASLAVGGSGPGLVDVRNGSVLRVLGETNLGVVPGPGFVVVDGVAGGAFSTFQSDGPVLVGVNAEATLDILAGARMTAPSIDIGAGAAGTGAVTVAGFTVSDPATLDVAGTLVVGELGVGTLTVTSGTVRASEIRIANDHLAEGTVRVSNLLSLVNVQGILGVGAPGTGRLEISQGVVAASALTVGSFNPNVPTLTESVVDMTDGSLILTAGISVGNIDTTTGARGARGAIQVQPEGSISVTAPDGLLSIENGEVVLTGENTFTNPRLEVAFVDVFDGLLALRNHARAQLKSVAIIGAPGREPVLEVTDTVIQVTDTIDVGDELDATRRGRVQLAGAARMEVTSELFVGPGGVIAGNGVIRVGSTDVEPAGGTLTNLGLISAGSSPGTIGVEGNLVVGPAGMLLVEVGGTAPGTLDVLDVSGTVKLGGTLVLRFLDGYLPQPGDTLPFLKGKKIKGSFDAVVVENAGPGFDFTLTPVGGALAVTAVTAAEAPPCRDPGDADSDTITCADDCPTIANPDQADGDADGIGDACDPCTDGAPLLKPVFALKKEKLTLKGSLSIPGAPVLDPAVTGARVTIEDATGAAVVTLDAPPGVFDTGTKTGWKKLTYASRSGSLRALKLGQAKKKPGTIKLDVKGVLPGVDPTTLALPLTARILLTPASLPTSLCGQVAFTGPAGVQPLCAVKSGALGCRAQKRR